jgi:hypothetical protein
MAELFFPQLASGALAQYPIKKTRLFRSIKNVLADGTMILLSDRGAERVLWQLVYQDLSPTDVEALQNHYHACCGPFHAFTFIDPTGNMFSSSSDLTSTAWTRPQSIGVQDGEIDPLGGTSAFVMTNNAAADDSFIQILQVPANYTYSLSIYLRSAGPSTVRLFRSGTSAQSITSVSVGRQWTRAVSSGSLSDPGTNFSAGVILSPGQQISIFGLQLEPQPSPSPYRSTAQTGAVYSGAHWTANELSIVATGPSLFSTTFGIDTAI